MEIQVKVLNDYTSQIDELRREAYYQNHPTVESKDEFDDISQYICLFDKETLVGYSRFTGKVPSVLHSWDTKAGNNIILPIGIDCCNYTRSTININYRSNICFFTLLNLEDLLFAYNVSKPKVMTVIEAEKKRILFQQRLGWQLFNGECYGYKPPDGITIGQYMLYDVEKDINVVVEKRAHLINRMLEQGINVKSEIFDEFKKNNLQ